MSKESKIHKITKGERTRSLILETAAVCIAKHGIDHTTTRLIASNAGISRGLVSYYIPKIDDLLELVIEHIVSSARAIVRKSTDEMSWQAKIDQLVRGNLESFDQHPHYYQCFLLSYYYSPIKKSFSELHRRIDQETYDYWYTCVRSLCQEHGVERTDNEIAASVRAAMNETEGSLLYYFVIPPQDRKSYIDTCVASNKRRLEQLLAK